jgi:hypothetical protein
MSPTRAYNWGMKRTLSIIAAAGLAMLVCGCGGGGGSSSSASTASTANAAASTPASGALAFSTCMRSHGLPSFPDPGSDGTIPKTKVVPLASSPQFPVAQKACQHLLPNTGPPTDTHAEVAAALSGMVRFATCMRSRGVQNWPDPTVDRSHPGDPRPVFDLGSVVDPTAPRITADVDACEHLMPQSTAPYFCSRVLAQRIPGSPPGAEACGGGSETVP